MYLIDVEEDEVDGLFGDQGFGALGAGLPHCLLKVLGDERQPRDVAAVAEKGRG